MKKILKDITLILLLLVTVTALLVLGAGLLAGSPKNLAVPAETTSPAATAPADTEPETLPADTEPEVLPTETETQAPAPEVFVLSFVGDCTLGCTEEHSYMGYGFYKTIDGDYGFPFRNVLSYFEEDDLTFVNLEGPLTNTAAPTESVLYSGGRRSS